jgi:hypothetical protein
MNFPLPVLLDETVRSLLHAVVLETELLHHEWREHVLRIAGSEVGQWSNQLLEHRRAQTFEGLLRRRLSDQRKRVDIEPIADTGGKLQRLLRRGGQASQFPQQQVHYVVGDRRGLDGLNVPRPARTLSGGGWRLLDETLVVEGEKELSDEEGVPLRLLHD